MEGIKEYLLGVIAAAIMCAVVSQITGNDGFLGAAIKLITGVFMLLALVLPVFNLRINAQRGLLADIAQQADAITTSASNSSQESISAIIKERTEAYILDKANSYGLTLTADVVVSDAQIPEPISVTLRGNVSPYNRKILTEVIETDLGISPEAQIWN